MIYPTIRKILRHSHGVNSCKLIIIQAVVSKPKLKQFLMPFIRLMVGADCVQVVFSIDRRSSEARVFLRLDDPESDMESFRELCLDDCYRIWSMDFSPELVVDGGGNIGLFTLSAHLRWPDARAIVFEPLLENVAQIQKNFDANTITADIFPFCLGGTSRDGVPFYLRKRSNQGGLFSDVSPYVKTVQTNVRMLSEYVNISPDRKCLIKLDIEGSEVDVIGEFLRTERSHTVIVGELHFCDKQKERLIGILHSAGWDVEFHNVGGNAENFIAKPANLQITAV